MSMYRANYMQSDSIAVFDSAKDNCFGVSLEWITYIEMTRNIEIKSAWRCNGKERSLWLDSINRSVKVDGICGKEVFEFNGCYFHGCPTCFPDRKEKLQNWNDRKDALEKEGYCVTSIWECEWNSFKRKHKLSKNSVFYNTLKEHSPINPREAFFGGRTNASKLYYKCDKHEKIVYKDFTSLYPWVNFYCRYPKGHPDIIRDNFDYSLDSYFGLVKCRVVPPKNLYHPVLPRKANGEGKLLFDLAPCVGTWTTEELKLAIRVGYRIDKIYEVHHFKESTTTLFKDYVAKFMKIKQEASGYPSWVKSEEDKDRYIREYFNNQGIMLDKNNIRKNEGLRAFAKLCLNNLWGRFGMRVFPDEWGVIQSQQDILTVFQKLDKGTIQPSSLSIEFLDDKKLIGSYNLNIESVRNSFDTNPYIAAFTSSYARIKLYEAISKVGENVLYYDTDSVIYVVRDGDDPLQIGDYLGDLTNELKDWYNHRGEKREGYITEFVSGGPKNYGYKLNNENTHCKVKGITIDLKTKGVINFDSIKSTVLNSLIEGDQSPINVQCTRFTIDKIRRTISTNDNYQKQYRLVYDKRQISMISDKCIDTIPFGY